VLEEREFRLLFLGQAISLLGNVPASMLSRLTAYDWLRSLVFRPIGYALAGVVAAHVLGIDGTLWLAAGWALASSAAVVALPSIRALEAAPASSGRA
jgi:hypothetical protein